MYKIRTRHGWRVLLTVVAILSAGCRADQKPFKLEMTLATKAKDVAIPLQVKDLQNPLQPSREAVEESKAILGQACVICHGADGAPRLSLGELCIHPLWT